MFLINISDMSMLISDKLFSFIKFQSFSSSIFSKMNFVIFFSNSLSFVKFFRGGITSSFEFKNSIIEFTKFSLFFSIKSRNDFGFINSSSIIFEVLFAISFLFLE
ncbi:hypothetical protein H17ap60334_11403 [Thermosipho africanus H17ap60334]|nr:hypothetical protein H17ap60334_11403 [Thermosipho africanus H17ap60334]